VLPTAGIATKAAAAAKATAITAWAATRSQSALGLAATGSVVVAVVGARFVAVIRPSVAGLSS
jgi:hypothetical protein